MSKLIYVYGDDEKLTDTLLAALREGGYAAEYTSLDVSVPVGTVTADIALVCRTQSPEHRLTVGGVTVDTENFSAVTETGEELHLTGTEFSLLSYLMKNAGRAVPRSELLSALWDRETAVSTRAADDAVKRLRKKIAGTRLNIETVWGFGFKVTEQ